MLIFQIIGLFLYPLKIILPIATIKRLTLFIVRKSLLYSFFGIIALLTLLTSYIKYIPTMEQTVNIQYHQMNGHYYGFVFDPEFRDLCQQNNSEFIKFDFSTTSLKFQKNLLCNVIMEETDNQVSFQNEYYQIWYQAQAQFMTPNHNSVLEIVSYQISFESEKNFKENHVIKMGQYHYFKILKYFPFRLMIKFYNKIIEFLDLNDTYSKTGELLLFTHIPNHKTNLRALILQITPQQALQLESNIVFTPVLYGLRYYFHFYFVSSMFFGTIAITLLFIIFWEVVLNINLWIFGINILKEILEAFG